MKRSREPEEGPSDSAPSPASTVPAGGAGSSDDESQPAAKITELDPAVDFDHGVDMHCSLPPHKEMLTFATYDEYETHYRTQHGNRCLECRRNFPSAYLLGLHIEEIHDSFASVRRERGERTYSCFVEGCDKKCYSPQKRRLHLIDKHLYPKNFFFAVTRDGIDGRRSLLLDGGHRRRRSSTVTASSAKAAAAAAAAQSKGLGSVEEPGVSTDGQQQQQQPQQPETKADPPSPKQKPDVVMDDLAGAMSSLQFVPPSIRFGRGGRKAGFAKR